MPSHPLPLVAGLLAAALLSACGAHQPPKPDYDPWEPMNRKIFWFNDTLDVYAIEPVARGWDYVVPDAVQLSITHFFNNLRFPIVFVNDLLQCRPRPALEELARFQINTFIGGLGFFDVAARFGLPLQAVDTGQTFGVWGISPGPYLVLPVFGPSNPRDTLGLVGDTALGFYTYFITVPGITLGATAINVINARARLIDDVRNAKAMALDYYTLVRNAYVQHRWELINRRVSKAGRKEQENLYNEEIYENYLEEGDKP